jgi:hypothetical protein
VLFDPVLGLDCCRTDVLACLLAKGVELLPGFARGGTDLSARFLSEGFEVEKG